MRQRFLSKLVNKKGHRRVPTEWRHGSPQSNSHCTSLPLETLRRAWHSYQTSGTALRTSSHSRRLFFSLYRCWRLVQLVISTLALCGFSQQTTNFHAGYERATCRFQLQRTQRRANIKCMVNLIINSDSCLIKTSRLVCPFTILLN